MELLHLMKFGYTVVIVTFLLMIWISLSQSREMTSVPHPPCYFNSLCSCSKAVPDLGIVRCRDIYLPKIPETINTSKVFMLHLENIGLRYMEPYFLQSTGLYKLTISRNPLSVIPDEAFLGLERSLWELDLSFNHFVHVPTRALRYLQKLRTLDLRGNDISKIFSDTWRGLENSLEVLILSDNSINTLPADAFSGLPLLDTIDLTGNNLRNIDPTVFRDGMGRLAKVLLGDNQLNAIPYVALSPLKMLRYLDLSHNRINKMQPASESANANQPINVRLSLDTLELDYNLINILEPGSFQYFDILNKTYLDGNQMEAIEENAFRQAKIKELYLRNCGLKEISPVAFGGLENSLQILDMSGNNLTTIAHDTFSRFDVLRTLSLRNNKINNLNAAETFNGFQYTLYNFDLSGSSNNPISIQDLRRFRNLRFLSLSRLSDSHLSPEDFVEFGADLEKLQITSAGLQSVKNRAFQYVHGLKKIDFSDNSISNIEIDAFADISHSLVSLELSHAFSPSFQTVPKEAFKNLFNLEELDLSNNRLKNMPDTSFHFLKKLKRLELQDNIIDQVPKGTFQGDIHSSLESIYFSFNNIRSIQQHTFVDLASLEQLHLDDNKIENLERRSFMNLENLKRLNLKGNKISLISQEAFQNLPELEDLDMSYNNLNTFEFSMFDQVGNLATFYLNASHNRISDLIVNVAFSYGPETGSGGLHSNIKVLDLSYNNISFINKQYFRPVELSLTHLYLGHNNMLNVTKDVFGNMPHLQLLDLSYNDIYELDYASLRNSKKIQVFDASNNHIAEIPSDIFRWLIDLRVVDLSNNRLRFLPDNLFREEGLERLDVSYNQLSKLPLPSFSIGAAMSLCELDLSWNSISSVTHGGLFNRFKSLEVLDLSYNKLVQIDTGSFSTLPRLSDLDLSHNSQLLLERHGGSFLGISDTLFHLGLDNVSLTHVPDLPLPNLLTLSLAYNSLPTVPPEMATNMSNLRTLNLNYNDLTAVPIVVHSLTELQHLYLAANPITVLSNTSLLGVADHLEELDVRNFELNTLETGVFCKMYSLRTLKMSIYEKINNFNIPRLLKHNCGLRNLEIEVHKEANLGQIMNGHFPNKLKNITFSGRGLRVLESNIFQGISSPTLHVRLYNTSIIKITEDVFHNIGQARNISIDVRNSGILEHLMNPSSGSKPNMPRRTFLTDLWMSDNNWKCDCDLGWIEVWQRKRRQYLCDPSPSRPLSFTDPDYRCKHPEDDLRFSKCSNKNNQSLIEILKTDIECGWSSAVTTKAVLVTYFTGLFLSFVF